MYKKRVQHNRHVALKITTHFIIPWIYRDLKAYSSYDSIRSMHFLILILNIEKCVEIIFNRLHFLVITKII